MLQQPQVKVERESSYMRSPAWCLGWSLSWCLGWGIPGALSAQDLSQNLNTANLSSNLARQLSAPQIKSILNQIRRANQQRDVNGATRFLADFVVSTSDFVTSSERTITQLNGRAEHQQALLGEFIGTKTYNYHGYQVQVQISPTGHQAIAQENYLLEVETANRQRVLFAISSTSRFQMVADSPQIFRVHSRVEMEQPLAFRQ